MEPSLGSLQQVDRLETQFSVLYRQKNSIGLDVLPVFGMPTDRGVFYKYDKRDMFRKYSTFKDPGDGEANMVRFKPTTDTFVCQLHALKNIVSKDKQAIAAVAGVLDPVRYGNMLVMQSLLNELEAKIATTVRNAAVITQNVDLSADPTTQFNDPNSRPRAVFKTARTTMIFRRPNSVVVPYDALENLRIHPDMLAAYQYVEGGVLSDEQIMKIIGVERMLVPDSLLDSADDASATGTYLNPWGKDILFFYSDSAKTLETLTFGWSPSFNMPGTGGIIPGMESGLPWRVRAYSNDAKGGGGSDVWETEGYFDTKIVAADLAYLIKNSIA